MSRTFRKFARVGAGLLIVFLVMLVRSQEVRPKIKVGADGWPAGHATPEGAACDLARAFIQRDPVLFSEACLPPFGEGSGRTNYASFLARSIEGIREEAAKKAPSPGGPLKIGKVFAARHLSKSGPASYAWASYSFTDVGFVDVGVFLQNGMQSVTRTFVIRDQKGQWYVHPAPTLQPLLCDGLNEEAKSTKDFADVYQVEKQAVK